MKRNQKAMRPVPEPTEAEIQHAAYLLWIEDGKPEGRELDHWLAAREKLRHRPGRKARTRGRRVKLAAPADETITA